MQVVKKTGLVPVLLFSTGKINGFVPAEARRLVAEKQGKFVPIPKEIATRLEPEPSTEPSIVLEPKVVLDIPKDWETLHPLRKVKIAKDLIGDGYVVPDGKKPAEYADEVIRAELEQRAAAETPSEPAQETTGDSE